MAARATFSSSSYTRRGSEVETRSGSISQEGFGRGSGDRVVGPVPLSISVERVDSLRDKRHGVRGSNEPADNGQEELVGEDLASSSVTVNNTQVRMAPVAMLDLTQEYGTSPHGGLQQPDSPASPWQLDSPEVVSPVPRSGSPRASDYHSRMRARRRARRRSARHPRESAVREDLSVDGVSQNGSMETSAGTMHEPSILPKWECVSKLRRSRCGRQCSRMMSFRAKRYAAFMVREVLFVLLLLLQFWSLQHGIHESLDERSRASMQIMHESYNIKLDQISFGFRGQATSSRMQQCAANSTSPACGDATTALTHELQSRAIELACLVNSSAVVVACSSSSQVGTVLDPSGIVSHLLSFSDPAAAPFDVRISQEVSFADFSSWNAPIWRERLSVVDRTTANHPADTRRSALVRYVAVPVHRNSSTLSPIIGALVVADIVDGKVSIAARAPKLLQGGVAAVYVRAPDEHSFRLASSMLGVPVKGSDVGAIVPIGPDEVDQGLLQRAAVDMSLTVSERVTVLDFEHAVAAQSISPVWASASPLSLEEGAAISSKAVPDVVLVQGIPLQHSNEQLTQTLRYLFIWATVAIAADWLAFTIGMHTFVTPLEQIAALAREHKDVATSQLRKLPSMMWYLVPLLLSFAVAFVALGIFAFQTQEALEDQLFVRAEREVNAGSLAWELKVNQMGFGNAGLADNPAMARLAVSTDAGERDVLRAEVEEVLDAEIWKRRIEVQMLVSANGSVLAVGEPSPGSVTRAIGSPFLLDGLIEEVVSSGGQLKVARRIAASELAKHAPVVFDEDESQRALHPSVRSDGRPAVIRWVLTPVHENADGAVVSVLVAGDIVDAKTAMANLFRSLFDGVGYAAAFVYERDTDSVDLLTSSPANRGTCSSIVRRVAQAALDGVQHTIKSEECTVDGVDYVVAGAQVQDDRLLIDGETFHLVAQHDELGFVVVLVLGLSKSLLNSILEEHQMWTVVIFLVEAVTCVLLVVVLFLPLRKFVAGLRRRGLFNFPNLTAGGRTRGSLRRQHSVRSNDDAVSVATEGGMSAVSIRSAPVPAARRPPSKRRTRSSLDHPRLPGVVEESSSNVD